MKNILLTIFIAVALNACLMHEIYDGPVEGYASPVEKVMLEVNRKHSPEHNIVKTSGLDYKDGKGHCLVVAEEMQSRLKTEFNISSVIDTYELYRSPVNHAVLRITSGEYKGRCADNKRIGNQPFPCEEMSRHGIRVR